jgi:hypothetical protein
MTKPNETATVNVFCPVCDKIKVAQGGSNKRKGKKAVWRAATEEEMTERAIDGDGFKLEHCPDCGGGASDRLTKYGERDEDGDDVGLRGERDKPR